MNTQQQILEIVRENKKPYLYLRLQKTAFQSSNIGSYECQDCLPDETIETRTERAVSWLEEYVKKFPQGSTFGIVIKSNPKANGTGVLGPIVFMTETNETNENNQGISGQPNALELQQMGFMSRGEVDAQILAQKLEFQNEIHRREAEEMKREFNDKLETQQMAYQTWDPDRMDKLANTVLKGLGHLFGKDTSSLDGVDNKEVKPNDLKRIAADNFADEMYKGLSLPEIEKLKMIVEGMKNKKKTLPPAPEGEQNTQKDTE